MDLSPPARSFDATPSLGPVDGARAHRHDARIEAAFRRCEAFAAFDAPSLAEFARAATRRELGKGERVWRVAAQPTHFLVVLSGIVKLVAPAGSRDTILGVFGPSESLGYWAVLEGTPYIGDAVAISDRVEVALVPGGSLLHALATRPCSAHAMHQALLTHSRALRRKIAVMSAGAVPQRLATLLIDLAERFGDELDDDSTILPVPLSRDDLAHLVGTTVETAIRAMRRWHKARIVETVEGGFLVRDHAALERIAARGEDP